jgi:hypothetical protein
MALVRVLVLPLPTIKSGLVSPTSVRAATIASLYCPATVQLLPAAMVPFPRAVAPSFPYAVVKLPRAVAPKLPDAVVAAPSAVAPLSPEAVVETPRAVAPVLPDATVKDPRAVAPVLPDAVVEFPRAVAPLDPLAFVLKPHDMEELPILSGDQFGDSLTVPPLNAPLTASKNISVSDIKTPLAGSASRPMRK